LRKHFGVVAAGPREIWRGVAGRENSRDYGP